MVCDMLATWRKPAFQPVTKLSIPLRQLGGTILALDDVVRFELRTPFGARRPPQMRAVIIEEASRTILVLCVHHAIADGISTELLDA